ncbi:hypothetical protein GGR14_002433 [Butyricimonas faecihominis]|uniref:Uncharacterized protein n=1 Tax=Butyricimonas faecihominis TaxID=1472416 RepID=A0A7W6MZ98_9BACT|nr:hypothetical protein [Butyricimonas faecihominis]
MGEMDARGGKRIRFIYQKCSMGIKKATTFQ